MKRYNEYRFSFMEVLGGISLYLIILIATAYLFYRSFVFLLISFAGIPFFMKQYKIRLIEKRKNRLSEEFSEALYSVSANVRAGYALENAFKEARKDMLLFFGDKSLMAEELAYITKGLGINQTLESLLTDLGERSRIDDIITFARVFETAKRNGGNIRGVIEKTAETLKSKAEIEKEIQVIIAEKKFELKIMEFIPYLMIAYIGFTSKGYFDIMYHNVRGVLFMSACLGVYILAILLGNKITKINV